MSLFIHDIREELAELDRDMQRDARKLTGNWFREGKIFLEHIEEEDIRILRHFIRLHAKAKDANPELAGELIKVAKFIIYNLTLEIKRIEKGQYRDFKETSKEAELLKRGINELHELLQRELDPNEIFRVIHLRKRFLRNKQYQEIYIRFFGPGGYISPIFLDPDTFIVYINADKNIPEQYLRYILLHEAWEHRVGILAYHEHPKYHMIPYAMTLDQIEDAIDLRSHEIATFEEFLAAKKEGKLDEYFEWVRQIYERDLAETIDPSLKETIRGRFNIKLGIYQHVKSLRI